MALNDLDRAIRAMQRGAAGQPELFRRLSEGELWALLPWHPEVEGADLELKEGMQMPFVVLADAEGKFVPIYSSEERVDEGLQHGKAPERMYSAGALAAKALLQILGNMELRAVVNYHCTTTGQIILPPDLMRDLADGSALQPLKVSEGRPTQEEKFDILNPADYPTAMLQPLFETLRRCRNFRAAWILGVVGGATPSGGRHYKLLVMMDPRNDAIFHDLEIVMAAVPKDGNVISAGLLDEKDPRVIAGLFRQAAPFFVAEDYRRPRDAKG